MKKILLIVVTVLLLILNVFIIMHGIHIGGLEILGVNGIKEKNKNLDLKIAEATKLISTDYPAKISAIEEDTKKLQTEKESYEDMVTISTGDDVATAKQLTKYNIEFLWTKIGNHATSEGITIKMDVTKGSNTTQETYNLNFTTTGSYIGISDFISDIENDSELGFKIEDFHMVPNSNESDLKATFVCKDIAILNVNNTTSTDTSSSTNTTKQTDNTTNGTTNTTTTNTAGNNSTANNSTTNNAGNTTNNNANNVGNDH